MGYGSRRSERVSDADRERVVGELAAHAGAGRLDVEELAARTEQAYTARTIGDLAYAMRDLPVRTRPSPVAAGRRAPIRFGLHLAAYAAALAVDVSVLALTGDGINGPANEVGLVDEIAILVFWALVAWGTLLLMVRAVYALRRPALPRPNP